MQEALRAEDRRLADAETSFAKAQKLISAQVFHEVRNALSSVIAISEMTSSMKRHGPLTCRLGLLRG
jgi:ABC-type tungstate transport system substrate-binding protein